MKGRLEIDMPTKPAIRLELGVSASSLSVVRRGASLLLGFLKAIFKATETPLHFTGLGGCMKEKGLDSRWWRIYELMKDDHWGEDDEENNWC